MPKCFASISLIDGIEFTVYRNARSYRDFLFITCCLILSSFWAYGQNDTIAAQKKEGNRNTVTIFSSNYYMPSNFQGVGLNMWQSNKIGINYKRKISLKTAIQIGYGQWNNMPWYKLNDKFTTEFAVLPYHNTVKPGNIEIMRAYKSLDILVSHKLFSQSKHYVDAGLGLSYTWGINTVIDSITVFPGYHDALIFVHDEPASYYGGVVFVCYNYQCFNNRLALGADLRYRQYRKYLFNALEYGFHIGYNF